jgi:hypothetical protein
MSARVVIAGFCFLLGPALAFAGEPIPVPIEPVRLPTLAEFRSLSAEQAAGLFETATADLSKLGSINRRVLLEVVQDKDQPATSYAAATSILVLSGRLPCPILDFKQFVEKDLAADLEVQPPYSGDGWPEWFTDFDNGIDGAYYVSSERLKEGGGWVLVGTTSDEAPAGKPDATAVKVRVLTVYVGRVSRTVSTLND